MPAILCWNTRLVNVRFLATVVVSLGARLMRTIVTGLAVAIWSLRLRTELQRWLLYLILFHFLHLILIILICRGVL